MTVHQKHELVAPRDWDRRTNTKWRMSLGFIFTAVGLGGLESHPLTLSDRRY